MALENHHHWEISHQLKSRKGSNVGPAIPLEPLLQINLLFGAGGKL